ncbi:MAG TPA: hypothetical protein VIH05_09565 [Tepidiformaceae bacterium]
MPGTEPVVLDERDAAILDRLQLHMPLVERPFSVIAGELRLDEGEVLARTRSLKERKLIRQMSAIFDAGGLGYRSSLVAAKCDPDRIAEAAAVISSYPGVSHNYRRNHDFNLWYTIAVPPDRDLEGTAQLLHELSGAQSTRLMPTLRRFKLGVRLAMSEQSADAGGGDDDPSVYGPTPGAASLTERQIGAVRALQEDMPVTEEPFADSARREGFQSAAELLAVGQELKDRGVMRRFAAILRHREAGFSANGMAVWKADEADCERLGGMMARFPEVTHCYQRRTYSDWPYSLFTMVHGRSTEDVEGCIAAISEATGLRDYRILYSTVEYKKRRVRYFTDEWKEWECQYQASRTAR